MGLNTGLVWQFSINKKKRPLEQIKSFIWKIVFSKKYKNNYTNPNRLQEDSESSYRVDH